MKADLVSFYTTSNLFLNPDAGERAVVIKTGDGDYMILIGTWTGFARGIAGRRGNERTYLFYNYVNNLNESILITNGLVST